MFFGKGFWLGVVCLMLFYTNNTLAQIVRSARTEAAQLKKIIHQHHVEPQPVDDVFSERLFTLVLNKLDGERVYFTQEEIANLNPFRKTLDDEIIGTKWTFLPLLQTLYRMALIRSESYIIAATESPVNVQVKIKTPDSLWSKDESELKERIRAILHIEILEELADLRTKNEKLAEKEFLSQHEPVIRQRIRLKYQRTVKRILNNAGGFDEHVTAMFLGCITHANDPHSEYFSLNQIENFMSHLSTEGFYFGIGIEQNDKDQLVITNMKPGGPAWKSGAIQNGDVIEKIRWEGDEWTEVVGMQEDEIDDILQQSNHNTLELMVSNVSSGSRVAKLKKEKINSDDNVVRSFVLDGKRKIGYISLPDFYSAWGEPEGAKCANDVAKEILKLKRENIQGLVLDVRFNGGGSLAEAVAMAGTFLDAGPMGIIRAKGSEPATMKDVNRGTVYDGPLLLMVNGLSASASEFLAAALQDYNRAIIAGARSYGKATGQEMFALTPGKSQIDYAKMSSHGAWGFATVTTLRIYRINGKTIQNVGIKPDIAIPDPYQFLNYHESLLPFSLKPDSTTKKTYYTPFKKIPIEKLQMLSDDRVNADSTFNAMNRYVQSIIAYERAEPEFVEWNKLLAGFRLRYNQFNMMTESMAKVTPQFSIDVTEKQNIDEYAAGVNAAWIKNISRDVSLQEAFRILCDYIDLQKP